MASSSKLNEIWIRRQKCPCGDSNCYATYEDDALMETTDSAVLKEHQVISYVAQQPQVTPYVGMEFQDDEDAFRHYASFALNNGFLIRKLRTRSRNITKLDFLCHRAGYVDYHNVDSRTLQCGCDARINMKKVNKDGVPLWIVSHFSNVHNHELVPCDELLFLPAYQKIQEALCFRNVPGSLEHRKPELEEGHIRQLPSLKKGDRNVRQKKEIVIQDNDASLTEENDDDPTIQILKACKLLEAEDEEFVYKYTLDSTDKLEKIVWSYGASVNAYRKFGDAVYFDTSYCSITYGMVVGLWLGVDNHGRVLLFGCVLMENITSISFRWALQNFIRLMKGRRPQTLISDLGPELKDVVAVELPFTRHVAPIRSVLMNISSWFSLALGPVYADFESDFKSLYHLESTEDFESQWDEVVSRYELHSDKHIGLLYALRKSWAVSYTRGKLLAQMTSEAYSKSADAFLKRVFQIQPCLRDLLGQIKASFDFEASQEIYVHNVITLWPMEDHAQRVLTPFAFKKFQKELSLAMYYATDEISDYSCLLRHFESMEEERLVTWIPNDEMICCSCKEFETSAILCRHSLQVLVGKNYFHVPEKYCKRWRRD